VATLLQIRGEMKFRPGIAYAGLTDVGCERENNEDRFAYWEAASDELFARKGRLLLIADGMGGYEGGQEASRIAIETIEHVYVEASEGDPHDWLDQGFSIAHRSIQDYASRHPEFHGMGTTCVTAAILRDKVYYAHVGDSRLYLADSSGIRRLTRDHSYVGRLIENGLLQPGEAETHPQRHILTAALGAGQSVSPELPEQPLTATPGSTLILCTDGLWSQVSDDEICKQALDLDPQRACQSLIDIAKARGGPDNITIQIARFV